MKPGRSRKYCAYTSDYPLQMMGVLTHVAGPTPEEKRGTLYKHVPLGLL